MIISDLNIKGLGLKKDNFEILVSINYGLDVAEDVSIHAWTCRLRQTQLDKMYVIAYARSFPRIHYRREVAYDCLLCN